jgi:hypothetical protein
MMEALEKDIQRQSLSSQTSWTPREMMPQQSVIPHVMPGGGLKQVVGIIIDDAPK